MDIGLMNYVHADAPKFNRAITRGLASQQLMFVEEYIDRVWRCSEPGFPPGWKYVGYRRCTPTEEYDFVTTRRINKRTYDFAQNDVYMVYYLFQYNGVDLPPRPMWLPYSPKHNEITIQGSTFNIASVLADKAISVGEDNIFIPLNRDKLTFFRLFHHVICDGRRISCDVVYSAVHHAPKATKGVPTRRTINAESTMAHYLFCKYGVTEAFKRYASAEVHAGGPDKINFFNYPQEHWIIFESTKSEPTGLRQRFYTSTDIRLAVPRSQITNAVISLVGGFYYVADRFAERVIPEYIDDVRIWRVLMGHVIFASTESEIKLLNRVNVHMDSLDGYIDGMVQEWLADVDLYVENVYDLFNHVLQSFGLRVTESAPHVASMYDKRLMVLRYVLIDIIKAIFNLMFALQVVAKKAQGGPDTPVRILRPEDINNVMNVFLKHHLITRINNKHAEISSVSNPGDCMSHKVTTDIVLQSTASNSPSSSKTAGDTSRVLHSSIAEVGQYNNLPKGEPTGRKRINPYLQIDDKGTVVRDETRREMFDRIQERFRR